jgi:hypothetical protein
MSRTPFKWMLVALVVMGMGLTGVALLRGQGTTATPTGDPAEDLRAVRQDLAAMQKNQAAIKAMLARAKKQKDIVRINCVQAKLEQVKNLIALAREQFSKYLMDKASGATGSPVSLRQRISMFKERVDEKTQEARQCAGEAIKVTDKPEVIETVDPKIPQDDPTQPAGAVWVMPRPPEASPYL